MRPPDNLKLSILLNLRIIVAEKYLNPLPKWCEKENDFKSHINVCIPARHSPSTPVSYGKLPKVFESLSKVFESLTKVSQKYLKVSEKSLPKHSLLSKDSFSNLTHLEFK